MKYRAILLTCAAAVAAALSLSSCEMDYYTEELYRKEIYLVSGENNIFGQEFEFGGDVGYVSVYYSGTVGIDREVTVTLAEDHEAIAEYNKRNFDTQYNDYVLELPKENYTIENMSVTLSPDSGKPYTRCPVRVDIDGLLADQSYFLPLRIESVSDYMASKTKNYVLMQVFFKNDYATTKTPTYYSMSGSSLDGTFDDFGVFVPNPESSILSISASKHLVPIGQRHLRMIVAAKAPAPEKPEETRNWGVTITVDPLQTVDIPVLDADGNPTAEYNTMVSVALKPYIDSGIAVSVKEIAGKPSYYDPEEKCFVLNYWYHLAGETVKVGNSNKDVWYQVSETMYDTRF